MLNFFVPGRPSPQGSKKSVGGGRFIEASKYLPAWRRAVTEYAIYAATEHGWDMLKGPATLEVVFYMERPATITVSKRPHPVLPPDIDKLCRAIGDSLSDARVWGDDSQVVKLVAFKRYADNHEQGAFISVSTLDENETTKLS